MDNLIGTLIAPAVMLILGWMLSKQDKLGKLVTLLQEEISRLNTKIISLEQKLDTKDKEIDRRNIIIAECYACRMPSAKCPALKMQAYFNHQKIPFNAPVNTNDAIRDNADGVHALQDTDDKPIDRPP